MRFIRPVAAFFLCLSLSLVILDVGMLVPDFVAGDAEGDWRGLLGLFLLVDAFATPVVALGGLLSGFFVLSGNRDDGTSTQLGWMVKFGTIAGAIYGALALGLISQSGLAFAIGGCVGAVAGAMSGAIWCLMVERPRHA